MSLSKAAIGLTLLPHLGKLVFFIDKALFFLLYRWSSWWIDHKKSDQAMVFLKEMKE